MLNLLLVCSLSFAGPEVSSPRNPDATDPVSEPTDPGTLVVEARVPTEVLVDGHKMVQLFTSGRVELPVAPGDRLLRIYVNGNPEEHPVEILPTGATVVVVGRTGITTGQHGPSPSTDADRLAHVQIRTLQDVSSQIRLDGQRIQVQPDEVHPLSLPAGKHEINIRSYDGTAIWATGVLTLDGGEVIIQIGEGRLPEVTGDGRFTARGG